MIRRRFKFIFSALCAAVLAAVVFRVWLPIGQLKILSQVPLADFTLLDHSGSIQSLHSYARQKAVILGGFSLRCGAGQESLKSLAAAVGPTAEKNMALLLLTTDGQSGRDKIVQAAAESGFSVPILFDDAGVVAKSFAIQNSSDAVIVEPPEWKVVYRGTMTGALAFEKVQLAAPLEACALFKPAPIALSYEDNVAPLIVKRCLNCHSENKKFQPYFDSYATVKHWSAMIRETLVTDRMPPFSADPAFGKYSNDISLAPEEKRLLVDWIDAGMPHTNAVDPLTVAEPAPLRMFARRQLAKTLLYTVSMDEPFTIPAGGTNEYRYFQLGGAVPFDMWVNAILTKSTNPRQLHHESLMVSAHPLKYYEELTEPNREAELIDGDADGVMQAYIHKAFINDRTNGKHYSRFQTWAAGKKQPIRFRDGTAVFIPKGYYLILESHHMGTGRVEQEQTTMQFYGDLKARGRREIHTMEIFASDFQIPAGESRYRVTSRPTIPIRTDIEMLTFQGHMHMRGRAVRLVARDAKGKNRTLFSVPNFYYGWQTGSGLIPETPVLVERGSALTISCDYDNSAENPNNPDPSKLVKKGQRMDRAEMCKVNVQYVNR